MKISYLVTVCNEGHSVVHLFNKIHNTGIETDELVILHDPKGDDMTWLAIQNSFDRLTPVIKWNCITHKLDNDYGTHKNFGVERCKGDWIFQIDGDEMPPDSLLGENLHALIEANPTIEAYAIPRINAWHGLTEEHAKRWGWPLDMSPTYKRLRAAWPDYQFRLFKRDYPRISFKKKLHERIEGYSKFALLPMDEDFALYHDKTIEKQVETNLRYNRDFSAEENNGVSNPRQ